MNNNNNEKPAVHSQQTIAAAEQIRYWCSVVTKIARADLQSLLDGHNSGIGAIEHGVLRHLSRGFTSMAEISRLMGVAPSTLVYVVDGLVKKRLVKRGKDPKDRRREPLLLEKRGAELFATVPMMDSNSLLVRRLDNMSESRRRELLRLLKEFVEGLPGSERMCLGIQSAEKLERMAALRRGRTAPKSAARR